MKEKKYTTTIRISYHIRDMLKEQADKLGMDMSSYIAYLVMYKEERDLRDRENRQLLNEMMKAMGRMEAEMMLLKEMEGREK